MRFFLLMQLWMISICQNLNKPNTMHNLNYDSISISRVESDHVIRKDQNQTKIIASSILTDDEIGCHGGNYFENYSLYFNSWNSKLDGSWEFTPYDSSLDHLVNNTLSHNEGRISSNFKCNYVPNVGNIIHIDLEIYNGHFKNNMIEFHLSFLQDFKNYTNSVVVLNRKDDNMHIWHYQFVHRLNSFSYFTNNTLIKSKSNSEMSIKIESTQKGFNGFIEIKFNSLYLGRIDNFHIIKYIIGDIIAILIWLYWVHTKTLDAFDDNFTSLWVSPITLALNLFWNILQMFEYFFLANTREEYFWFYILMIFHLWMIVHQYYFIKCIYLKYEQKFISNQHQIYICIILFLLSVIVFLYDMLFDCTLLTMIWGFIWIPQIVQNVRNGFTINNDSLIISLSLNFLYFPLWTKFFEGNIFELEPNCVWMKTILFGVFVQIVVLKLQEIWGWRFFIPNMLKIYWLKFNDVIISDSWTNKIAWAIWLNYIESSFDVEDNQNLNTKIARISWGHSFHYFWLRDCLKHKNEWPLWRKKVFDTFAEQKRYHLYILN